MLGEDPRENRIAEWFRGLTMGVRIQIVLFSVVGIVLASCWIDSADSGGPRTFAHCSA